ALRCVLRRCRRLSLPGLRAAVPGKHVCRARLDLTCRHHPRERKPVGHRPDLYSVRFLRRDGPAHAGLLRSIAVHFHGALHRDPGGLVRLFDPEKGEDMSEGPRKAWEIDRELRLSAIPLDRRVNASKWYTSSTVFPTGDDLTALFWNVRVPGSGAPEIPYVEMVESMA